MQRPIDYPKTIAIIGGGLGGLALAGALKGKGYDVTVFERDASSSSRSQGYHIGLNAEGSAALAAVIPSFPTKAIYALQSQITKFVVLSRTNGLMCRLPFAGGLVDRYILRDALLEGLEGTVQWGKQFVKYEEREKDVVVHFADGSTATADFVVGADGARSGVRRQRCPNLEYESVGVANTVGSVTVLPAAARWPTLNRFCDYGMVRLLGGNGATVLMCKYRTTAGSFQLFWTITERTEKDFMDLSADELRTRSLELSKAFNPEFEALVNASEEIYAMRELHSTKPMRTNPMVRPSRVTLLGDAAHAMTTHRGLGANTTFLDVQDLCHALTEKKKPWLGALAHYEQILFKRGFKAVAQSRASTNGITASGMGSKITNAIFWVVGCIFWVREKVRGEKF